MLAEAEVILKEGKYDDSKMHCGKKYEHIRFVIIQGVPEKSVF